MERQASMHDLAAQPSVFSLDMQATRRKLVDHAMLGAVIFCAAVGVAVLAVILIDVIRQGAPALSLAFFLERPLPIGEAGGGVAPAIIGTLMMLVAASVIGVPIGVGTAIYLAEYGGAGSRTPSATRSTCWPGCPRWWSACSSGRCWSGTSWAGSRAWRAAWPWRSS
jgi:hypothetical protein